MPKITPCLWFDGRAEEAANFYLSIFKKSKLLGMSRYGDASAQASGMPKDSVLTVSLELEGQEFLLLNGTPSFPFSQAVSFMVNCKTQKEIDHYWDKLIDGGEPMVCGWLKDKYGLPWQIVPTVLGEYAQDKDPKKAERLMAAMIKMVKLDIAELKRAYEGA